MRLLKVVGAVLLVLASFISAGCSARPAVAVQEPQLGMNLASVAYWSSEIVFVDVFKQSQSWTSQAPGKPYGQGGPLAVDARGWVKHLNGKGHFAESLIFNDLHGHYPGGDYVCLYEGAGEIEFAQAGKVLERKPGRLIVKVTPADGPVALQLLESDPSNPVRDIRLLMPGHEKTYKEQPFYPPFLKQWRDFKVIRFMNWGMTNNSKVKTWAERATPQHATQTTAAGVALEYQVKLANTLNADPWLCIPHLADDDYVREFAKVVRANLSSDRKIYLEFSNECWHPGFEAGRHCAERGQALGLSKDGYEAGLRFYAQRSVEIFKLVEEAFGGSDRLVRILATPPDSSWAIKTVLDRNNTGKNVDAIAIAPYFGAGFGKPAAAEKTAAMSVDQLLDACQQEIDASAKTRKEIAKLVHDRGLKLLAYEGGQHLVGTEGTEENERVTKLFLAANRDPRMKDLYLQDLRVWREAGGGLYCVFDSTGRYSKWGSWGVLEYTDQDEKTAPKLLGIREFMRK